VDARAARREAALLATAFAVLYLLTLTANHGEAEDAVGYAAGIRDGDAASVLHPHHVLWGALAWVAHNLALALGYDGGALGAIQFQNALVGAAGVGLLWWWLRSLGWDRLGCAMACGVLGFSYGYWFYSGESEVYVLSATLLIACLALAHRAALRPSVRAFALLGLANGLAVLTHDTNVLFAVPVLAALLLSRGDAPLGELARRGLAYGLVAVAVTVPSYAAAALANGRESPAQAYDWLSSYAVSGPWGNLEPKMVPNGAIGAGRTLVGGHSAFAIDATADAFGSRGGRNPREELYFMRDYPTGLAAVLLALTAAIAALALAAAVRAWRARRALDAPARALAILCACWAVTYAAFFTWWEPINVEFWIATWVPLAILLAIPLRGGGARRDRLLTGALVGLLAVVNLAGSMIPAGDDGDDYWRARTRWYADNARPGDLVLVNNYLEAKYIRYFAGVQVVDPGDVAVEGALEEVSLWRGRVLVSREAFDPGADEFSTCGGGDQCAKAARLRRALLPRARLVHRSPLEWVWELRRPGGSP
jgi:hypothetical protein